MERNTIGQAISYMRRKNTQSVFQPELPAEELERMFPLYFYSRLQEASLSRAQWRELLMCVNADYTFATLPAPSLPIGTVSSSTGAVHRLW